MYRICFILTVIIFLISGSLMAGPVNSQMARPLKSQMVRPVTPQMTGQNNEGEIYYFLNEYIDEDSNEVDIVLEVSTDSTPSSPGSGFEDVTADELNQKGLPTPTECENSATYTDFKEDPLHGYGWGSWITPDWYNGNKRVYCGSYTSRSWVPGYLGIHALTRRKLYPTGVMVTVYEYLYLTWGYYTKLYYRTTYRPTLVYDWYQDGWHWWENNWNPRHIEWSAVYKRW
jgi:hypothetical protein